MPGAFLASYFYRLTRKVSMSWFGEFLGTGMIGSFILAPVMVWFWTYSANGDSELLVKASQAQSLLLFTPRFVLANVNRRRNCYACSSRFEVFNIFYEFSKIIRSKRN